MPKIISTSVTNTNGQYVSLRRINVQLPFQISWFFKIWIIELNCCMAVRNPVRDRFSLLSGWPCQGLNIWVWVRVAEDRVRQASPSFITRWGYSAACGLKSQGFPVFIDLIKDWCISLNACMLFYFYIYIFDDFN